MTSILSTEQDIVLSKQYDYVERTNMFKVGNCTQVIITKVHVKGDKKKEFKGLGGMVVVSRLQNHPVTTITLSWSYEGATLQSTLLYQIIS